MAELLAKYKGVKKSFEAGEKVTATVLEVSSKSLVLDIGGKSEGLVVGKAFSEAKDFIKKLKVGEKVAGSVLIPETPEGYCIISLRSAVKDYVWAKVDNAMAKDDEVTAEVKGISPSGLIVEVFGLSGFIPSSQLGSEAASKTASLQGKSLKAKIIEVDKSANRIILSEKQVSEAKKIEAQKEAVRNLAIGKVYKGTVVNIFDFGAFVRIEVKPKVYLEGLVHVSEISWDKIGKPSDELAEGQEVNVKVINIRNDKVSLSIKQAGEDPWEKAAKKYRLEDKVAGTVVKMSDFGAFISLEPGIEGLLHITKIPPAQRLSVGDKVNCYIEEIDPKEKRISLGLILTSKPVGYK
jgi:ribosomal protein S1